MTQVTLKHFSNNKQFITAGNIFTSGTGVNSILLAGDLSNIFSDTSANQTFPMTLGDGSSLEVILVTVNAFNNGITAVRAQEGTAQFDWPIGTGISMFLTAADMDDFRAAIDANDTLITDINNNLLDSIVTNGTDVLVDGNGNVVYT